jgi:curved DNA-binding protein CbpA
MLWLGIDVAENLTEDLIKKKYKIVVRENHPDVVGEDKAAEGSIKLIEAGNAKRYLEDALRRSQGTRGQSEENRGRQEPPRRESPSGDPFAEYDRQNRERARSERERRERERVQSEERVEPIFSILVGQLVWADFLFVEARKQLGVVYSMNRGKNLASIRYPVIDSLGELVEYRDLSAKITDLIPFREGESVLFKRSNGSIERARAYSDPNDPYQINVKWENDSGTRLTRKIYISQAKKIQSK